MILSKAIEIFAVLQDKFGSPNLVDDEIIDFINQANNEYLNRLFPDSQGAVVNFESNINTLANIRPLIYILSSLNMNVSGVLTDAVINAALAAAASDVNAQYFRIGSIGFGSDGYPAKFLKANNRWSFQRNYYKRPSLTNPRFSLTAGGLQFYPTSASTALTVSVIKKPKVLTDANLADALEFEDYVIYNIIGIALKLAGVSTRDEQLIQDIRMTAVQNAQ